MALDKSRVINASEIAQYAYCPVAWFLRRNGIEPNARNLRELGAGLTQHKELGARIGEVQRAEGNAGILLRIGIALAVAVAIALVLFAWSWSLA